MASQPNLKRVWCVIGLMILTVMLVAGLVVHSAPANAISESRSPAPKSEQCVSYSTNAAHNNRPKPWLKIVVSHVISVATRLAA